MCQTGAVAEKISLVCSCKRWYQNSCLDMKLIAVGELCWEDQRGGGDGEGQDVPGERISRERRGIMNTLVQVFTYNNGAEKMFGKKI